MDSFETRLGRVDPRLRRNRVSFYRPLMEGSISVDDAGLPRLRWLLAESDRSESTFRDHFGVDKYPELQPCAGHQLAGLERLVMETKTLTADPYLRGYREMTTRLHQPAPARLSALMTAVAAWALRFRALSGMEPRMLPDSVEAAARALAGPGADGARMEIMGLLATAVSSVQDRSAEARPAEVLSGLRLQMAGVFPLEDDLLRASRELASHVGDFMLMSAGNRADVSPELRFVLQRALRVLRLEANGEGTDG